MNSKVVLITGASNGIGKAMAILFAQNGYRVVIGYNNSNKSAQELANSLCQNGHTAICVKADISKDDQVNALVQETISTFGHIDVLINNAGVCSYNLLIDEDIQTINKTISTNLVGTINCTKYVCKHMMQNKYGKIINMSSVWGLYGASNESIYSASKGGIIAFTKAMAKELSYSGITVNCIAPGIVDTNMMSKFSPEELSQLKSEIPLGRFANPDEIAQLALFLASDNANYITGQTIQIDGGFAL
ncbi:MAG: SDR family oxidoreductase [Clostridia bacterium]|nr:SDR family oxidoreductase [Clostridia bacterium]